jgi:ubiquinol-cytochrome c reductase iron-sulfur subunit
VSPAAGTDRGPVVEHRAERRASLAFVVSAASSVALAVVYWRGGQPQAEGTLLGLALAGISYGLVTWANHLLPSAPVVGEREPLPSSGGDVERFEVDLERGRQLTRRRLLTRTLLLAGGALGAALVFPLRSLGPQPGRSLVETPWKDGLRLVTGDGRPVMMDGVPQGGTVTVFPEGQPGSADGQAVLIRVGEGRLRSRPGREDWSPAGFVAYSRLCTHAGCPVGLYEPDTHRLFCPCHQSVFAVLDAAEPKSGPATRPLPQLPLTVDGDGYLVARGDYTEPIGPGFWNRGR